ncbi:hypothetical protein [Proteus faecis]|uniref:hypothetical protein n=1 Tax=Proteus faecis TaxID=2050967 RepID=UPI00301D7B8E
MKMSKILEPINKCAENLNKFFDKVPSISKTVSIVVSNLAAYTVVNGLILLIAIKASCKYPNLQINPYNVSTTLCVILFFFFINDVFTHHIPKPSIRNKKFTLPLIITYTFKYILFAVLSFIITSFYIASIYQPLISIPDSIFKCTS